MIDFTHTTETPDCETVVERIAIRGFLAVRVGDPISEILCKVLREDRNRTVIIDMSDVITTPPIHEFETWLWLATWRLTNLRIILPRFMHLADVSMLQRRYVSSKTNATLCTVGTP